MLSFWPPTHNSWWAVDSRKNDGSYKSMVVYFGIGAAVDSRKNDGSYKFCSGVILFCGALDSRKNDGSYKM